MSKPDYKTFSTGIEGLNELLLPKGSNSKPADASERNSTNFKPADASERNSTNFKPADASEHKTTNDQGILYREEKGFFGVVLGAAGSGKSILALQLACCGEFEDAATQVVYLSHEPPDSVKARLAKFMPRTKAARNPIFDPSIFSADDLTDLPLLASKLKHPKDLVSEYIQSRLLPKTREALDRFQGEISDLRMLQTGLVADLHEIVIGELIDDGLRFFGVMSPETHRLSKLCPRNEYEQRLLNRLLLEDAFPLEISRGRDYFGCRREVFVNENEGWFSKLGLHIVQLPFDVAQQVDLLMNIVDQAQEDQKRNISEFSASDWINLPSFLNRLKSPGPKDEVSRYLMRLLLLSKNEAVLNYIGLPSHPEPPHELLIEELNKIIREHPIYEEMRNSRAKQPAEREKLIDLAPLKEAQIQLNKQLLQAAYPKELSCHNKTRWLVLFDNAETIFSQSYEKAFGLERSDDTKPLYGPKEGVFLKRLRERFAKSEVSSIFFFEEPGGHEHGLADDVTKTGLAYAADVVIHLSCRTVMEYRQRTLEVIKARNQSHRRGQHHFSIRGCDSEELKPGMIIYPSIATQLHVIADRDKSDTDRHKSDNLQTDKDGRVVPMECLLGIRAVDQGVHWQNLNEAERIEALDRMDYPFLKIDERKKILEGMKSLNEDTRRKLINLSQKEWADLTKEEQDEVWLEMDFTPKAYLQAGTVSVLVSDLDSIASEIALHFSLQNQTERTLYLTTLHRKSVLEKMMQQYTDFSVSKENQNCLEIRDLLPEHIGEAKLLHDIDKWIANLNKLEPVTSPSRPIRVVVDNVFRLSKKFPLIHDEGQFFAALFALLRKRRVVALVVDMVDVGEGSNPLHESVAAGLADHVFILRHAQLRSEVSKLFSVAKLAGLHEPDTLWELNATPERIVASDNLAFYKGTLSDRPEAVEVMLSLFAESEGSPLHKHLQAECALLKDTFGQRITVHTCHPETYGVLQQSVEKGNLSAMGDCHVISVDEIWLGELIRLGLLQNLRADYREKIDEIELKKHGFPKRQDYVVAGQDIAISRQLKRIKSENEKCDVLKKSSFAVPDRLNVGILAYDPNVWTKTVKCQKSHQEVDADKPVQTEKTIFEWFQSCSKFNTPDLNWFQLPTKNSSINKNPEPQELQLNLPDLDRSPTWEQLAKLQKQFVQMVAQNMAKDISPQFYRAWENEDQDHCENCQDKRNLERLFLLDSVSWMPQVGVFTICMETLESCVSFFLELVLSVMKETTEKGEFLVKADGKLNWEIKTVDGEPNAWEKALSLMLELLSPWDLMRLSHSAFRSARYERPCLFSRQWFTGWGMHGQTRPGLIPLELPLYNDQDKSRKPACVSGAWYLAILGGGTAPRAGAQIIKQLTSPEQQLFKFNHGIGMPVTRHLYDVAKMLKGETPIDCRQRLLYVDQMVEIADTKQQDRTDAVHDNVQMSRCPFFRESIEEYHRISPVLMGMMVEAAKTAVKSEWLWSRNKDHFTDGLGKIVERAKSRCEQVLKEPYDIRPVACQK